MKTAAIVLLVIGLSLGTIGGAARVLAVVFGDSIARAAKSNEGRLPSHTLQVQEGVRRAADRSPGHLLAVAGNLALVLAGGAIGIAACTLRRPGVLRTILGVVVIACGIGLLLLESWVAAGAYVIGGFLAIVDFPTGEPGGAP